MSKGWRQDALSMLRAGGLLLQVPETALFGRRAADADTAFSAALHSSGHALTPLQVRPSCQRRRALTEALCTPRLPWNRPVFPSDAGAGRISAV